MKPGYVLILFGFLYPSISHTQRPVLLTNDRENVVLNSEAKIYTSKETSIHDIQQVINAPASCFKLNTHRQEVSYGFHQPQGWCEFTITNLSGYTNWMLKIQQSWLDSAKLFVVRENKTVEEYPLTGHFQTIGQRPVYSLHFVYSVTIQKNETITCYLYTQRTNGRHAAILYLQTERYLRNYDHIFNLALNINLGMIILAALVGLVLYFFISDKIYLYYSIYCACFLLLIISDSGYLHAFFGSDQLKTITSNSTTFFFYWTVGWHILFTVQLLDLKTHRLKWVYWTGRFSGWLFCLAGFLLLFLPITSSLRWWLVFFSYYVIFFMDSYILFAICLRAIRKEPAVLLYLAGFLSTAVAGSILVFAELQLFDGVNQNSDFYYFTPLIEILCMVLGLGIHFSRAVKEKLRVQVSLNKVQQQVITAQEDERERIGRDLHDAVGNSLAGVKSMLVLKKDHAVIEKEIDSILTDVRDISHDLMPVDFKEYALPDIIKQTVRKFAEHPGIAFDYEQAGKMVKLQPVTELFIYRIVNELIHNAIKHSQASEILIQLMYGENSLVVTAEDNGKGIDHDDGTTANGIGLKNIQYRVSYIGATLNFESNNKGTIVIVEIPYASNE
jgi:signal transduction histidine kinase